MADTPDVRVRLSAEGTAEVIAAFQKVASAAKKSGKDSAGAFQDLGKQFDEVGKKLAGLVTIGLIAEKFGEFFKQTLEGAESLERLSRQTGLTTTAIQAYQRAARDVGISQEQATAGLSKFTTAIGRAEIGTKQSAGALGDLGISIKTVSSQSADQNLLLVAQRLAGIADPARRARDEMALFARGGVQLDQALIKLGQEGFGPFIAELQRLGLYLDTDALASLEAAQRSFRDMHDEVKGLAQEFIVGLAPGLAKATDEMLRLSTSADGASGFAKFGAAIGDFLSGLVGAFGIAGNDIAAFVLEAQIRFSSYASAAAEFVKGNWKQAVQEIRSANDEIKAIEEQRLADNDKIDKNYHAKASTDDKSGARPGDGGIPPEQQATLLRAKLQLTEAYLNNELALYKAQAAILEAADKAAYEAGTLSLSDYFAQRAQIINNEIDKEISNVQAKRAAVAAQPVGLNDDTARVQQQTELVRLDGQLGQLQLQRAALLIANTNEEAAAQRKLYADTLKAEQALLTIEGRKTDAARVKLAVDLRDLDAQLRAAGVPDDQRTSALSKSAAQGNAQIGFGQQLAEAQAGLAQLQTQRKAIQDQVTNGALFDLDAAQQTLALDRARLPALQAQADALVVLAQQTHDTDDVSKAEAYKQKIDELTASTKILAQQTAELKKGIEGALGAGITKFFQDAERGAKGFKNAFHDMAQAIEQDLLNIANKILEQSILQQLFAPGSSPSGGGASGAGGVFGLIGALFGQGGNVAPAAIDVSGLTGGQSLGDLFAATDAGLFAGGGQIRGPGSGTSDSIPLWASDGEFVVSAKATAQPGVLQMLHALNQGQGHIARLASGGLVSSVITPKPAMDSDANARFVPGMAITQNFHIAAPHGSISRKTQKQLGAEAYKSLMRAHQANN